MKNKNIFKLVTAAVLVAMISFVGCQKMEIVKVVGFIQGQVFDGTTNAPLDSVKVVWTVAGVKDSVTATTDDGYLIKDLPVGEYSLWVSKSGYTTIVHDVTIQDNDLSSVTVRGGESKEQVVTLNPNLYPLNAGVTGRVYKKVNSVNIPAAGAVVILDYNTSSAEPEEYYRFVPNLYQTTTDNDGYFTFTNVPAANVNLRISTYTDGDGETYGSYSDWINLDAETSRSLGAILINNQTDPMSLINSNAWSSVYLGTDNFAVADDITLTFNKNVDETNTTDNGYVQLTDNDGNIVAATLTYTDNVITIHPDEDLIANKKYSVSYRVYSTIGYYSTTSSFSFRTIDNSVVPVAVANLAIDYDNMGTGWVADYNTQGIYFIFDIIPNALYYEVYVKDDYNNTEFVQIISLSAQDYQQGKYQVWFYLPARFDYYEDDGITTPFSHGTTVSYKVRAVNSAGAGPFSNVVTVKDETSFTNGDMDISNTQSASANNTGTSTITITMSFSLFSGRYADVSVTPNVRLWNGGTEVTPFTSSVSWDDHQSGTITFDVPAGTDYSGMELRLYNITDSSGNTMDPNDYEAEALY